LTHRMPSSPAQPNENISIDLDSTDSFRLPRIANRQFTVEINNYSYNLSILDPADLRVLVACLERNFSRPQKSVHSTTNTQSTQHKSPITREHSKYRKISTTNLK
jgi:hypothetical protein